MTTIPPAYERKQSDKQIRSDLKNVAEQKRLGNYEINIKMNNGCKFPSAEGIVWFVFKNTIAFVTKEKRLLPKE